MKPLIVAIAGTKPRALGPDAEKGAPKVVMKRLLLIISSIFALVACSNGGISPSTDDKAISFSDVSTRATLSDLEKDGFGVWAGMENADGYIPILENEKVYQDNGAWTYDNKRYWFDDYTFYFVACYPYDENSTYYSLDTDNEHSVKLSVTETPSEVDFLMATNVTDTSVDGYSTTVSLEFAHVLTQVGLKIWRDGGKHQNDQMRITKVTLGNIYKGGSYSSATATWTPSNEKLTAEKVYTVFADDDNIGAAIVNDNGTLETGDIAADPFGTMLLLPQTTSDISLKIEYQLKRQNAVEWESAELETKLSVAWEKNKRYTYNVVLSSVTDITIYYIQTKVDPWGTPQVGGTVIIK